jgi:catechol-2,3-dioxygenase
VKPTHLRGAIVAATDAESLAEFYAGTWGLSPVAVQDGRHYFRGTGPEHHILTIVPSDTNRLVGYELGLADRAAVDAAAEELEANGGVTIVAAPGALSTPGGGYGMTIADPEGRLVTLSAGVEPAPAVDRPSTAVHPVKISHVVLNSPDADATARFFEQVIGFERADELPHMIFLRCNQDHHSLAISRAPHASLNHIAFAVPSTEDVLRGVEAVRATIPLVWGPNRHVPGNNTFGYFLAPNGQVIEYTAEVDQIDPANPPAPKLWRPEDNTVVRDSWAVAETLRPTPEAREAMTGSPEPPLVTPSRA